MALLRRSKLILLHPGQPVKTHSCLITCQVERKRCFRAGPQESGSVSSVVRYLPNAAFPSHAHPQGEEIFVLDGTFSDQRGDHKKGVFLLNPEGFSHAPSSVEGNKIFVRLRQ